MIPHELVYKYLCEEISDKPFINLIMSFLKAGYKNPKGNKVVISNVGLPQGGIISPILCNIVLHKFDEYMENAINKFEKGRSRRDNPEYQKLDNRIRKAKTLHPLARGEIKSYLIKMKQIPTGDHMDPKFKRMMYVRYADEFIILVTGSKDDTNLIKLRCKDALKRLCGAELSDEKTLITNLHDGFNFLGAEIRKLTINNEFSTNGGAKSGNRIVTRRLAMNAPIISLLNNLEKGGMGRRNSTGKFLAKGNTKLTNLSHYDIVTFYNFKIHGIKKFYSFASNYSSLGTII
jgi:hypothetical protein